MEKKLLSRDLSLRQAAVARVTGTRKVVSFFNELVFRVRLYKAPRLVLIYVTKCDPV